MADSYVEQKRAAARAQAIAAFEEQVKAARGNLYGKYEAEDAARARLVEAEKARDLERQRHLEADLAAVKAEKRAQFFSTHPTAADSSFESYWQRIKADEAVGLRTRQIEQAKRELRATGKYF